MDMPTPPLTRFPVRQFFGQSMQTQLSAMQLQWERLDGHLDEIGYDGRRVLGYRLPRWQRREKWSDDQCIRFLESVWSGVGIGSFMVNFSDNEDLHMILLDGQQRLRAIERYWAGELMVPGADGHTYFWTDLTEREQAHFLRIPFPWFESNYKTEEQMIEAYNRHNFGGTAHTPEERAQA